MIQSIAFYQLSCKDSLLLSVIMQGFTAFISYHARFHCFYQLSCKVSRVFCSPKSLLIVHYLWYISQIFINIIHKVEMLLIACLLNLRRLDVSSRQTEKSRRGTGRDKGERLLEESWWIELITVVLWSAVQQWGSNCDCSPESENCVVILIPVSFWTCVIFFLLSNTRS